MTIDPIVSCSMLAKITPAETGVLDSYDAGIRAHVVTVPDDADVVAIRDLTLGAALFQLDLTTFIGSAESDPYYNPDGVAVDLAILYGLTLLVTAVEDDTEGISVEVQFTDDLGTDELVCNIQGTDAVRMLYWPEGFDLTGGVKWLKLTGSAAKDVTLRIVAIGKST